MISENDKGLTKALVWTSMDNFSYDTGEIFIDRYFLTLIDRAPVTAMQRLEEALLERSRELGKDLMFLVETSWKYLGDEPSIRIAWRPSTLHEAKS